MEDFIVSARKYRPDTFDTVIGQESITDTLKNAIRTHHTAQAYLFCGPRGVGKTTAARILAKTLNCSNLTEDISPCNECESCIAFNEGRSYNIHELDAASNNSVEDIRNLTEQVRIPPQIGKYSVYIIDEVHMLSQQAFNAFLKTLEEPPSHAIFILATTEKHKIIPTILSRCQIFDFNRIQVSDIENFLETISQKEGIHYEHDALNIVAQKADGAMRDALSIYDQILSFAGNNITYKEVIDHLNILDYDYYFKLTDYFLQNANKDTLLTFNDIINNGFDPRIFITGLSRHFRDLLVAKDESTLELLEVGVNIRERYKEQAANAAQDFLLKGLELLNKCDINYNMSLNKRLHVELTLLELTQITAEKKNLNHDEQASSQNVDQKQETSEKETSQKQVSEPQPTPSKEPKKSVSSEETRKKKPSAYKQTPSIKLSGTETTTEKEEDSASSEKDIQDKETPENKDASAEDPVTPEQLQEKWAEFAHTYSNTQGRHHLYTVMTTKTPVLEEDYTITLHVDHGFQRDAVNEVSHELLGYLRNELNNFQLKLNININETPATEEHHKKPLYTNQDKYRHMKDKNPQIDRLREQFNLDFD